VDIASTESIVTAHDALIFDTALAVCSPLQPQRKNRSAR
jgi:hypothetical protein